MILEKVIFFDGIDSVILKKYNNIIKARALGIPDKGSMCMTYDLTLRSNRKKKKNDEILFDLTVTRQSKI